MAARSPNNQGITAMFIVDSQIHIWENARMSAHHRQIPTYDVNDALAEMKSAGVDAAVLHPLLVDVTPDGERFADRRMPTDRAVLEPLTATAKRRVGFAAECGTNAAVGSA